MTLDISDRVSPAARRDILDLDRRINAFRAGDIADEAFRKFGSPGASMDSVSRGCR